MPQTVFLMVMVASEDDQQEAHGRRGENGRLAALTPREKEVLDLLCEGLGNGEIAGRLVISEKTAKVHVSHILEKLGVRTRVQAVLAAGNGGTGLGPSPPVPDQP